MTKFLKKCWFSFAAIVITLAVISGLSKGLTPVAMHYKKQLEQYLSLALGERVSINSIETGWYIFEPVIKLQGVSILQDEKVFARSSQLLVGINLLASLKYLQIRPGNLYIDDLNLNFTQKDGGWEIEGLNELDKSKTSLDLNLLRKLLTLAYTQKRIVLSNLSTNIHLEDGSLIPLTAVDLSFAHCGSYICLKGIASLAQKVQTHVKILTKISLNINTLKDIRGLVFLSTQDLLPSQWQKLIPRTRLDFLSGKTDLDIWLNLVNSKITSIQSTFSLKKLSFNDKTTQKKYSIPLLQANLAWNTNKQGWQLTSDHIHLRMHNFNWIENSLLLRYKQSDDAYFLFIKNINLSSLIRTKFLSSTTESWPKPLQQFLMLKPHGELSDTQIGIKAQSPTFLLTRFSKLGWGATTRTPGVDKLAGVIAFEPNEGHLEVDSEVAVLPKIQKSLLFSKLFITLAWKELSDGLRIRVDSFNLSNPSMLLTASGVIDSLGSSSNAQISMQAQLSASNAAMWLPYLPDNYLKPRLNNWLKHDVKRIDKISAEVIVGGPINDFPFDNQTGEFVLRSHIQGLDLDFANTWPSLRNIEGYLHVDKRTLDADIIQATTEKINIDKGNLRINSLGLNKERLLLHTEIATSTPKALEYVANSPVNIKLLILQSLHLSGRLNLSLRLDLPLYPKDNTSLIEAKLKFMNNSMSLPSNLNVGNFNSSKFKKINGGLEFNQDGILSGKFKADFLNYPLVVSMQRKPIIKDSSDLNLSKQPIKIELHAGSGVSFSSFFSSLPQGFILQKALIQLNSHEKYTDIDLAVKRVSENSWSIRLEQAKIKANLYYQLVTRTLTGLVDYLDIKPTSVKFNGGVNEEIDAKTLHLQPNDIPNLDLTIKALHWGVKDLGEVKLKTSTKNDLVELKDCTIASPVYQIRASGAWKKDNKINSTALNLSLYTQDLAKNLEIWELSPVISSRKAQFNFEGMWPFAPYKFALNKLNGKVKISLMHGQITNLSEEASVKIGLGKLLSILSLQTIPRRLSLDFSDLSAKGYSFDIFNGNFNLVNGVMTTEDSMINGPVAQAFMKGSLDVAKQLYNLDLEILPHITASLPLVATIAGGPVAGIATWVASKIINQGMQKISGYTYKVTGSWQHPVVQQVSIIKKAT